MLARLLSVLIIVGSIVLAVYIRQQDLKKTPKSQQELEDEAAMTGPEISAEDVFKFDKSKCPAGVAILTMGDVYLRGVLEKDQPFRALLNWYKCHAIRKGDLVLYRYSQHSDPVVRMVTAIPGDKFRVVKNKEMGAWNLKVNGILVRAHEAENKNRSYYFGAELPPPLGLYERANKGVLKSERVIISSSFPPGNMDSGTLGVISLEDIIGKVVLMDQIKNGRAKK